MPWSRLSGETANFMYCCFFHRDRIQANSATASAHRRHARIEVFEISRMLSSFLLLICGSRSQQSVQQHASRYENPSNRSQAFSRSFPYLSFKIFAFVGTLASRLDVARSRHSGWRGSTTARLQRSRRRQSRCVGWSAVGGMGRYSVSPAATTGTHATFILAVCSTLCDTEPYHHRPRRLRWCVPTTTRSARVSSASCTN